MVIIYKTYDYKKSVIIKFEDNNNYMSIKKRNNFFYEKLLCILVCY